MSTTPSNHKDDPLHSTRTVAIIKSHALDHRLSIESHILDAGFEIVKERQMEFDPDSDQDFLHELFGRDTSSLFEGPVWVYVLERLDAIELWSNLIGHPDPEVARSANPTSLRAIYGISLEQNALIGAPNTATAEEQIACLFASSPPFRASELPATGFPNEVQDWLEQGATGYASPLSDSQFYHGQALSRSLSQPATASEAGSASAYKRADSNSSGKAPFKARPVPPTTSVPSIRPRTTRAASLRAGMPPESTPSQTRKHVPRTREEQIQAFLDVPGHKRSEVIPVASTAPPVIVPRITKAAALRMGLPVEPSSSSAKSHVGKEIQNLDAADVKAKNEKIFQGVPGHKRRESFSVPSVKPPVITPRSNRSSALRINKDVPPPSSFMFRTPSSSSGASSRPPSSAGQNIIPPRRSQSQASIHTDALPPRPPSITPRTNRSAELRALKGVPSPSKNSKSFSRGMSNGNMPSSRAVLA